MENLYLLIDVASFCWLQEIFYYTNEGNELKSQSITTESTAIKLKEKGNREVIEALTAADSGVLAAGALPDAEVATEAGKKALMETIHDANLKPAKTRKTTETKKTEEAEPKTILEYGTQSTV